MSINLKGFMSSMMTDSMYASALSNFFSSKTEYAQERIADLANAVMLDDDELDEFIANLDQDVADKLVPYFPHDEDEPAKMFKFSDILQAYCGREVDVEGLTPEVANDIANDLSGSTASMIAGCVGLNELSSRDIVSASDLIAAVESKCGSISDEMLSTLSVLNPILSSDSLSLRDKLRNIMGAFGMDNDTTTGYTGFGPIPSILQEATGVSGFSAFLGEVGAAVIHVTDWIVTVGQKILGFVDGIFGGILSTAAQSVVSTGAKITGKTDATELRGEGEYSDLTCDNANFGFTLTKVDLQSFGASYLLSKLSHKYAIHLTLGFGTLDMWYQDDTEAVVNCVIHWKPCDSIYCLNWLGDHAVIWDFWGDGDYRHWLDNSSTVQSLYEALYGWLAEAETPQDIEQFLANYNLLLTSEPPTGYAGIDDGQLYCGIVLTQCFFFAMLTNLVGHDVLNSYPNGFSFGIQAKPYQSGRLTNYDIARRGALTTDENLGAPFSLDIVQHPTSYLTRGLLTLVSELSTTLGSFDFSDPLTASNFIPYVYISSFCTGKYHIIGDNALYSVMKNALYLAGIIAVAIIGVKIILAVKKVLWVRAASLDYKAFEIDVATDGDTATRLYKESVRLSRAEYLISVIVGSAKTVATKAWSAMTGLVNGIAGRISSIVSTGDQSTVPSPTGDFSLKTVVDLIKG